MLEVSVVVCAHTERRWDDIVRATSSARSQSVQPREVVLVVDHNERLRAALAAALDDVRVIANDRTPGASGARNAGVATTHTPVVAFLDDDAEAAAGWLERSLPCFDDERVLGVGGTIDPEWPPSGRPQWFPPEFQWVVGCTYPGLPTSTGPVRNLIAANMLVRADVFAALSGFRVGFGKSGLRSGTEETDLCIRASQRWPDRFWLHHPGVRVRHRVSPARTRLRYFIGRCHDEGMAKASIVSFVGADDGLASERRYARTILSRAVAADLHAAVAHRDPRRLLQAGAVVTGLAATGAGYAQGRFTQRSLSRGPAKPSGDAVARTWQRP